MRAIAYHCLAGVHLRHAIRRLRWLERKYPTPLLRFAVPPAFRGRGHFKSMRIMQHSEEILRLYQQVRRVRPRRVLEIGTALGGTLYLWAQAACDDGHLVSVDLPDGPFGGGYAACRGAFYQAFCRPGQRLDLLRGDAREERMAERVRQAFGGEGVDFLFIDADHTFSGVCRNFQLYAPLVRPGGLVALHDVLPNPDDDSIEVHRLWERLKGLPGARQFVGSAANGKPLGIGVVRAAADRSAWPPALPGLPAPPARPEEFSDGGRR